MSAHAADTGYPVDPRTGVIDTDYLQLANAIAAQAQAIATQSLRGPLPGAVKRLASNVELLASWTPAVTV